MLKTICGALLAAALMFMVGYGFYATPLGQLPFKHADATESAAVQQALKYLPQAGLYQIPDASTAEGMAALPSGPTAIIHVGPPRAAGIDTAQLGFGYLHYVVVALAMGMLLGPVPSRARFFVLFWASVTGVTMIHLGGPIWWHKDWASAIYFAVADMISLIAGGIVMARFLTHRPG